MGRFGVEDGRKAELDVGGRSSTEIGNGGRGLELGARPIRPGNNSIRHGMRRRRWRARSIGVREDRGARNDGRATNDGRRCE